MKDIIINDCEDCGLAALNFMVIMIKEFSGSEVDKQIIKEKAREILEYMYDYFNNIEILYASKKNTEEGKLKESLLKLRELLSLLNDLIKLYCTIMPREIEKIIEQQIKLIKGMKKTIKDSASDQKDAFNNPIDCKQVLNYLYIIRFVIEIEIASSFNGKELKDNYLKDIIRKGHQTIFKRLIFLIKQTIQNDDIKEHLFICLSRIASFNCKEFEPIIIKNFKTLLDEKLFIGEGTKTVSILNKGYSLMIAFISICKSSNMLNRNADQSIPYVSHIILKLLNIIQNISGTRNETTKKALEVLLEFIEMLNSDLDKELLNTIIESFAYQFETIRKKFNTISQCLKETEVKKKEYNDYNNKMFNNHFGQVKAEIPRPQQPNIYEENLILLGNIGIFNDWDGIEEFASKLLTVLKLSMACIISSVAKLSRMQLGEQDIKYMIRLFRKGIKLGVEIKLQFTKDFPKAEEDIEAVLKSFITAFLQLRTHPFTKFYTDLAEFIVKLFIEVKPPINLYLLGIYNKIREDKKSEKPIELISFACCIFNQLIKSYSVLVRQAQTKDQQDQILQSVIKYCTTSFDRISTLKEQASEFARHIMGQLAKMFIENSIIARKIYISKSEAITGSSIIPIAAIRCLFKTMNTLKEFGDFSAFSAGFIPLAKSLSQRSKISDTLNFIAGYPAPESHLTQYMPEIYDSLIDEFKLQTIESVKSSTTAFLKWIDHAKSPQIFCKFNSEIVNCISRTIRSISQKQSFDSLNQIYDCLKIIGTGPQRALIYQDKEFKIKLLTDDGIKIELKEKSTQMPIYLSADIFSNLFLYLDSNNAQISNKIIEIICHIIISLIPSEFSEDAICKAIECIKKGETTFQYNSYPNSSKLLSATSYASAEKLIKCFFYYMKKYYKSNQNQSKQKGTNKKKPKSLKIFAFLCHHFAILYLYKNGRLQITLPDEINPLCFIASYRDVPLSDSKINVPLKAIHKIIAFYSTLFEKDNNIWDKLEIVHIFVEGLLDLITYIGLKNLTKEGLQTAFLYIYKFIKWLGVDFMAKYQVRIMTALFDLSIYFPSYAFEFHLHQIFEKKMTEIVTKFEQRNSAEVRMLLLKYISHTNISSVCKKLVGIHSNLCGKSLRNYLSDETIPVINYLELYHSKQYNELVGHLKKISFLISNGVIILNFDAICNYLLTIVQKESLSYEAAKVAVSKEKFNIFAQGEFYSFIEKKILISHHNLISSHSNFEQLPPKLSKIQKAHSEDIVKELFPINAISGFYDKKLYKLYLNYSKRVKAVKYCLRIFATNPSLCKNDSLCSILLKLITREEKELYVEASKLLSMMFQTDYTGTLKRDEIQHFFFNFTAQKECNTPPIIYCRNLRRLMKVCKYNNEIFSQKLSEKIKLLLSKDIGPDQLICIKKLLSKDFLANNSIDLKDLLEQIISKSYQSSNSYRMTEDVLSKLILKLMRDLPEMFANIILEKYEGVLFDYLTGIVYKHCSKDVIIFLANKLVVPDDLIKDDIPTFYGRVKLIYIILRVHPHRSENYLPLKKYIDALANYTNCEYSSIPPLHHCLLKSAYKYVEMLCIIYCSLHAENTDSLFESVRLSFFYYDFDVNIIKKYLVGKYEYGRKIKLAAPEITNLIKPETHKKIILDIIHGAPLLMNSSIDKLGSCISLVLLPHLNELRKEGDKWIDDEIIDAILNYTKKKDINPQIQNKLIAAITIVIPYMKAPDDAVFECIWANIVNEERSSAKAWSLLGCCLMRKHELLTKLEEPQQISKLFFLFSSLNREFVNRHQDIIFEAMEIIVPYIFKEKNLPDFSEKIASIFKNSYGYPNTIEATIKVISIYEKYFTPISDKLIGIVSKCLAALQQIIESTSPRKFNYFSLYKSINDGAMILYDWVSREKTEGKAAMITNIVKILQKAAIKVWDEKEIPDYEIINESYKLQAQFVSYLKDFQDGEVLQLEPVLKEIAKYKHTASLKNNDKEIYCKLTNLNLLLAISKYACNTTIAPKIFECALPYLEQFKQPYTLGTGPQKQIDIINAFYSIYDQLQSGKYNEERENGLYVKIKKDFDATKESMLEVNNEIKILKEKYNRPGPAKPYTEALHDLTPTIYKMVPHIAIKLFPIFIRCSKNEIRMKEYTSSLLEAFKNMVDIVSTLKFKNEEEKDVLGLMKLSELFILTKTPSDAIIKDHLITLLSSFSLNIFKIDDKKVQADFIQYVCRLAKQCEKTKCPDIMMEIVKIIKLVLNDNSASENGKPIRDHVLQALREIECLGSPELEKDIFTNVFNLIQSQTEQNSIFDFIRNPIFLLKYKGLEQRQTFYQLNERQFGISLVKKFETIFVYMAHSLNSVARDFSYWYFALSLDLLMHNIDDTHKIPKQSWMLPKINEDNSMKDVSLPINKISKHASKMRLTKEKNIGIWMQKLKDILIQSICDFSTNKERLCILYHPLFCSIFQQYWSLLKPNEMEYISSLAEKFIMTQTNFLNFNSNKKLSILKSMLEVFTSCTPYMKFSPELIQHVGKLNGGWHNTTEFLEAEAIAFPQNERFYYSLNEMYSKIGENDYKYGLVHISTSNAALNTSLALLYMDRYDEANALFNKILISSDSGIGDEFDIHINEPSASGQIAKNVVEVAAGYAMKQLSQWDRARGLIARYPSLRISSEYTASQYSLELFQRLEKDVIACFDPFVKVLKLLTCSPKDGLKQFKEAFEVLLFDCQCNNPTQLTHAQLSYLNYFQMGVDIYEFHMAKEKLRHNQNSGVEICNFLRISLRKGLADCEAYSNLSSILQYRNKILDSLGSNENDFKIDTNFIKEETSYNFLKLAKQARKRCTLSISWKYILNMYLCIIHVHAISENLAFDFYKEYSKISTNTPKIVALLHGQSKVTYNSDYDLLAAEHCILNHDYARAEAELNSYLSKKVPPNYKQWKLLFLISHQSINEKARKMEAIGLAKLLAFNPQKHMQYVPFLLTTLSEHYDKSNSESINKSLRLCPPWIWIFWLPQLIFFEDKSGHIIDTTDDKYKWIWTILNSCIASHQNAFVHHLNILKEMSHDLPYALNIQRILIKLSEILKEDKPNHNLYFNVIKMLNCSFTGLMHEFSKRLENIAYTIIATKTVSSNLNKEIVTMIDNHMLLTIKNNAVKENAILLKNQIYKDTIELDWSSMAEVIKFLIKWSKTLKAFINTAFCQGIEDLPLESICGAEQLGYYSVLYDEPFGSFQSYANNLITHCITNYSNYTRFMITCTNGRCYEYNLQFINSCINEWKSLQTKALLNYYINLHFNTKTRFLKFHIPTTAFCYNIKATNVKVDSQDENSLTLNNVFNFITSIKQTNESYWIEECINKLSDKENPNAEIFKKMKEIFPPHSLAHYIHRTLLSYEDLFLVRRQMTYSWASNSFLQYIFGVFAENINDVQLSTSRAKITLDGIDLTKQPYSIVPFRMGSSTQYFINPIGMHGPFKLGLISLAEMMEYHYRFYVYKGIAIILGKAPAQIQAIQGSVHKLWNCDNCNEFSRNADGLIQQSTDETELSKLPAYACLWV